MHVIDSHTGGEPTRVVFSEGPQLGDGPLSARAEQLATQHRAWYRSVLLEPRGQVAMVGALLVEPTDVRCVTGVIYFDVDAVLGMCGHGTIGLVVTLAHAGHIGPGTHYIETPVGVVEVALAEDRHTVTVTNVESYRSQAKVAVDVAGLGTVSGDVAFGGNWFFLVDPSPVPVQASHIASLTQATIAVREALVEQGIAGENAGVIDHIIFYGPSPSAHSKNFVLCPDNAYDRSPCGTGSSARLACLAAEGLLAPGQEIVLESVIGSTYRCSYRLGEQGRVVPSITGQAYVMAQSHLVFAEQDPFRAGIELAH